MREKRPKLRIVLEVPPSEYEWISRLAEAAGGTKIDLVRTLLDAYAAQINFEPRPK